ncbi:coagulation factor V [Colossoma macropomum]|uniref:coagulation factor V n=1 Tax=Colossoma macropomum TaxID=42526 RepID=UPI001864ED46|nr:coagulation factor V [Colossoma macropomum]
MRLCSRPGACCALVLLAFLTHCATAVERHYYIAAVNIDWDYSSNGHQRVGPTYRKTVYREYEPGFKQAKTHPSWSGLLGPTLRGQEGDTIIVTFKNMADRPCSIHPHGIAYGKQSEGSLYFDNTSNFEKEDDVIYPDKEHTYYWEVTPDVTPKATDPPCVTYMYFSHVDFVRDYNTGLIGTLLICKDGSLDDSGNQVHFHQEFVLLFGVFDENNNWYSRGGAPLEKNVKYTINGYTNGDVPDLRVCAHSKVTWHFLGMSSEPELFSVHFNGQVLQQDGHKVSSVGIISGTATSAEMVAVHEGRWLLSSHISKHLEAGMHGFLTIDMCEGFTAPKRKITIQQSRESQEWTYYIAAEEIIWDYAPNMPDNVDGDFRSTYLRQSAERIGKKYKKAVFTQYKDKSFKERAENKQKKKVVGILGPVIRAQIRDVITIVFKNRASRPYSIYPHGLTIDKTAEGANYPEGGNQSHAVQPGETYTYVWRVIEEDEPLQNDSRCLTRMYHSAVNTPRDIASGLVGPLLICKSQSLNTRNVQLRADKEQHAMFAVFDENKSWYLDENINTYCGDPKRVKKDDTDFYKSNVMHTINGYVYESGQVLGFCNGEIVTWHVSSVGDQDGIQTATFYGHTFELNNREEDILNLFPMTGETISMNMANDGIWLLASLNTHETTKGVRLKFRDVECFRDYVAEDEYSAGEETYDTVKFSVWIPKNETEAIEEKTKTLPTKSQPVDEETDNYADMLGLRTFSNSGNRTTDMEQLDLAFLDHDEHVDSSPGLTDKIQNTTNPELEHSKLNQSEAILSEDGFEDKNITSQGVQNQTLLSVTLESADDIRLNNSDEPTSSPVLPVSDEPTSFTYNSSNIPLPQDKDGKITSEISHTASPMATEVKQLLSNQTSEHHGEIATDPQTVELLMISTAEVEEVDDRSSDVFTYSVHAAKSPVNISEVQEVEEFVLLAGGDQVETIRDEHVVEYNISPPALPNNITLELQGNITQNITDQEDQQVNNTEVSSKLSNETGQELKSMQVDSDFPLKEFQELNATQLESGFENDEAQQYNSTQVDSEFPLKEFQELNATQLESGFENDDAQQYNGTQVVSEFPLKEFQELNSSRLDSAKVAQEFNSTQEDSEFSNITLPIENRNSTNSSELGSFTDYAHSETTLEVKKLWNKSEELSSQSLENTSLFNGSFTFSSSESFSNGTLGNVSDVGEGDFPPIDTLVPNNSSEAVIPETEEGREEVVIYLQNSNNTEVILTSPLDPQAKNWSYEGKHELVPMEVPDHIRKYITDEPEVQLNKSSSAKENKKIVLKRVTPVKGFGIKTKKRIDYKPQPRSALSPRSFSPRGFAPSELTPRGPKPVSSEEIFGKHIVIGIPRKDFNDYEIYAPKQEQNYDFDSITGPTEEYEYIEYKDPYRKQGDIQGVEFDEASKYSLQMAGSKARAYYITAEEVDWDYAGYGQRREDKASQKRPTRFKKVVFREYLDISFTTPYVRGEVEEHLGILGPVIKAEVDETIFIVFRNLASRPYSLHANGVSYGKNMEGLKYEDESPYWYRQDDVVQPNTTFFYMWTVNPKVGPLQSESDCRIWAYYSGVNPERDIHSGLIGPLLVCRKGTLNKSPIDTRDFMLLFMTFDETKSWYYETNRANLEKTDRKAVLDPEFNNNIKFHAINGIIYSLKGLRMYTNQLVKWHLINMGSPKDFHSIHFHGQTFLNKHTRDQRQGVYPLLPGGFATLEMWPSKPGLWLLESEIGISHQMGMQTLFLVLDNVCEHPLGLNSGAVKNSQITASDSRSYWLPSLARLHNTGKYNAWSTTSKDPWIQVDFQRPVVISKVATQGAKQLFSSHFVLNYTISYSTDRRRWIFYKGDSKASRKTFEGNREAHEVKENIFFPPIIGRFVRLYPSHSYNYPTVRMEFYGCELDGCSVPLGMQSGLIGDHQITASSVATSWYSGSWNPWFARLDKQGAINAWQAKSNDMQPWLQIELKEVKKITGIVTQGAKSLGTEMFVTTFVLEYSEDGKKWTKYTDEEDYEQKTFTGNSDNNEHMKNYIYPPIFSKFIRIIPKLWQNSVTMRVELLGCDFE